MSFIRQKYDAQTTTPLRRRQQNPYDYAEDKTASSQPYNKMQKIQYSPLTEQSDGKKESRNADQNRDRNLMTEETNYLELRRLMNLVELQQQDVESWKRRCIQLEDQLIRQSANRDGISEYELHFEQLTTELQYTIQQLEDTQTKLRERDNLLQKLSHNEEQLNHHLNETREELLYAKSQLLQLEQDRQIQLYSVDQASHSQVQTLQQSHLLQIAILNDSIKKLQHELRKRSEEIDTLVNENQTVRNAFNEAQKLIRNTHQAFENYKAQQQEQTEENRREIYLLQQTRDQQLFTLKKETADEKTNLISNLGQLEYQLEKLNNENSQLSNENDTLKNQVDELTLQVKQYQIDSTKLQIESDKNQEILIQIHKKQLTQTKQYYKQQLDELMNEVHKLTEILKEKTIDIEQYIGNIAHLQVDLATAEKGEIDILEELEHLKSKYQELQQRTKHEFEQHQDQTDHEIEQLEAQISRMEKVLLQKSQECDDNRHLKNEVSIKLNDSNLLNQKLLVELECLRSKFIETQRQNDLQEQVREEIKRSQMEQMRRALESTIDQLENENRNIKFLLENKSRECEEWRQNYMKVRPSAF